MSTETRYGSTGTGTIFGAPVTTRSQGSLTNNWAQVTNTSFTDSTLDTGGIRYRSIGSSIGREDGTAYPFYQSLKNVPIVGEVILIIPGPKPGGDSRSASGDYYLPALNIWNNPQAGRSSVGNYLPQIKDGWQETIDNNPLYPYPGDVILEGRKGQSIRLSESLSGTPWQGARADLSTIAIVSGINPTGIPEQYVTEDINKDASSIYLLQGQRIPLETTHQWKRGEITSYGTQTLPLDAKSYTGNQVVLNSSRVYLNTSSEHVLISAQQHVGLLGDQVHIDGVNSINLAAPIVSLTTAARNPAVKGNELLLEIENLYSRLLSLTETLSDTLSEINKNTDTAEELKDFLIGRLDNDNQKLVESLLSKTVLLS